MKSKILLLSLTILGLLSSCTNLDEELFSQVESEDYGKTASEVETIVGGAYSSLRGLGMIFPIHIPLVNMCSF